MIANRAAQRGSTGAARRLAADRRGAIAMEFAILVPVITVMLFGALQYGTTCFTYNMMVNAARSGARAMASSSATEADAVAAARAVLPGWVPADQWTVVAQDTPTTGTNMVNETISVPTSYTGLVNLVPMPQTLSVQITMIKAS